MNNSFNAFIEKYQRKITDYINQIIDNDNSINNDLADMMKYSVDAGGKRLRPLILLSILKGFKFKINDDILQVCAALEAIHTYSLIHDDLPAMDNDDFRRGKLTSHKKFGEAQAILAGDSLLTIAFEWIAKTNLDAEIKNKLILDLAHAAGPAGMVAGQLLDIQGNDVSYNIDELKHLHLLKTGCLIKFPAQAALNIANEHGKIEQLIIEYVTLFGLAFQIHDDIIDVEDSSVELGKTAGKDQMLGKNTYVSLLGLQQAKIKLNEAKKRCNDIIEQLLKTNFDVSFLAKFLIFLD